MEFQEKQFKEEWRKCNNPQKSSKDISGINQWELLRDSDSPNVPNRKMQHAFTLTPRLPLTRSSSLQRDWKVSMPSSIQTVFHRNIFSKPPCQTSSPCWISYHHKHCCSTCCNCLCIFLLLFLSRLFLLLNYKVENSHWVYFPYHFIPRA